MCLTLPLGASSSSSEPGREPSAPVATVTAPVSVPASPAPVSATPALREWTREERSGITLWRPATAQDGQLVILEARLKESCTTPLVATWLERTFPFVPVDGLWQVLLPIPLGIATGSHGVRVACGGRHWRFDLAVAQGVYPESVLRVAPKYDQKPPARAAAEQRAITRAFAVSEAGRLWRQAFKLPATGVETSPFGGRRTFNGTTQSRHRGIDFDGKVGDPIYATNDGVVVLAAPDLYFTGSSVFVDHGHELFTVYFHMSRVDVSVGQRVTAGQQLGQIGSTGRVTGPHLHFGVRLAGTYVNPWDLLRLESGVLVSPARGGESAPGGVVTTR